MNQFDNISPLDYRYYDDSFKDYLSEESRIKYQVFVEATLVKVLAKNGICSEKIAEEVEKSSKQIKAEEVYGEEKITRHDIRALVNCIRKNVSDEAKPFIHLGATSYDIVDTANAIRYKDVIKKIVLPALEELEKTFIELALREKNTLQIGRTHGQHAEPITFGFAIAEYVSRLGGRILEIKEKNDKLVGKFSGAVGAYNASALLNKDPIEFEKQFCEELGLLPSISSNQVIEPEPLLDLMHSMVSTFGVLANFSDDMRNLQRSELNEVAESFGKKQVGSSTMPHKRNPINFENVKSLWKEFMPRMITFYLDSLTDHQRDLTNSASARFIPEVIAGLVSSTKRLNKITSNLVVDKESMQKNFDQNKKMIVAEPLYILLAFHNHPDAHEAVRELTLESQKTGKALIELAENNTSLKPFIEKFSSEQIALLREPEKYLGKAVRKTELICEKWKKDLESKISA